MTYRRISVSRNATCPCGSGLKYKKCCQGEVAWEEILAEPPHKQIEHLSLRGKNLAFVNRVAEILELDRLEPADHADFKRRFTANRVQEIYQTLIDLWPSSQDLDRVLESQSGSVSGLYIGDYSPSTILTGVTRHALYADRILLADPIPFPLRMRDEYNPILNPALYLSATLKWMRLWFSLVPWIDSGLIGFVRTPGDFDPALRYAAMKAARQRYDENAELKALIHDYAKRAAKDELRDERSLLSLMTPDSVIEERIRRSNESLSELEIQGVLSHIEALRNDHPYYVEALNEDGAAQVLHFSSGTNYEMGKITALRTGSYLVTDSKYRWEEMSLDREFGKVDEAKWTPFAKAFHSLRFPYLDDVPLEVAFRLRKEGRLEDLRNFLRKVWRAAHSQELLSEENVENLAAELGERVNEAEWEWNSINRDLLKWAGVEAVAGVAASGVLAGQGHWVAGALAVAGVTNLAITSGRRNDFRLRYPAGVFMDLKKSNRRQGDQ